MVSHDLLKRFSAGFQRFQKTWYCPENNIYEELRAGQNPYALVIACSDSRVDPVLLLDATPGDLFVIRNVANLVPPYEPDSHHHGVSGASGISWSWGTRNAAALPACSKFRTATTNSSIFG